MPEAQAQIQAAFEAGVNFIDTANVYSEGGSESIVGEALANLGLPREDLVIATKVRVRMGPAPNRVGLTRVHIMNEAHASLRRLRLEHIDLYQIHGVDQVTPLDETLRALEDLVRSGKVRYIGLSNHAAWQIMKGLGISERRELEPLREHPGLLLHRRPRPGARDRAVRSGSDASASWSGARSRVAC